MRTRELTLRSPRTADGPRDEPAQSGVRTDADLIHRVACRDLRAFEALYRIYHPRLSRFLLNILRRPPLVEEVLNDVMMAVWDRPWGYNGTSKLSTWIFAIAYRKALKALRRQDQPVEDAQAEARPSAEADPEEALGQSQVRRILASAIDELSTDHRTVVDLAYFHGSSYREIAEIMSCPVETVKTRMYYARRHLKNRLAGRLQDWL